MTPNDVMARVKEIVNKYLPQMSTEGVTELASFLTDYADELRLLSDFTEYSRKGGI